MTKPATRPYHAPLRAAGAERTRLAILSAAKERFEALGWAGTKISAIAGDAKVSPKTIEAQFQTKAALLAEVVAFAIRGSADEASSPTDERELVQQFKDAPSAIAALPFHAAYATPISARSAGIAWAVEAAAAGDARVAEVAARMRRNRRFGAQWAAKTVIGKRGLAGGLTIEEAERVFMFAIDPATYRTLTGELGLDQDGAQEWMLRYERGMLLLRT